MQSKYPVLRIAAIFASFLILVGLATYLQFRKAPSNLTPTTSLDDQLNRFTSINDFKKVLSKQDTSSSYEFGLSETSLAVPSALTLDKTSQATRYSQTNVQTAGIDEPDIVKTDGSRLFYSIDSPVLYSRGMEPSAEMKIMPPLSQANTKIINIFPISTLSLGSEIKENGNLLLFDNILVIFGSEQIVAFDTKDANRKLWQFEYKSNTSLVAARKSGDLIYLVLATSINRSRPCPIEIMGDVKITCSDIYYFPQTVNLNTTYTVLNLNSKTGIADKTFSFVASSASATVYMSSRNLYIANSQYKNLLDLTIGFAEENGGSLFNSEVLLKLSRLKKMDISLTAKLTELNVILEEYKLGLSDDERLKYENDYQNQLTQYYKNHARDLSFTSIVKLNLDSFSTNTGSVPGIALNQHSLDEYQEDLRIATTIGRIGMESFSDVYILSPDLHVKSSVSDLGQGERIYSVRFIDDKGYVVTFKQTDPFYVLDLSPSNPRKTGELKIPGYSSYLHPLQENLILGVGEEDNQVKLSLFDVSDPTNPKETDKYTLDEYWTEVNSNAHAFLQDAKHAVFFLPSGRGGYIFSYKDNSLNLNKAVSLSAKRAVYVDDYLYIVSSDKLVVLSEDDWSTVSQLEIE